MKEEKRREKERVDLMREEKEDNASNEKKKWTVTPSLERQNKA